MLGASVGKRAGIPAEAGTTSQAGGVVEVDVFWYADGGLGCVLTWGDGRQEEREAPGVWGKAGGDFETYCVWLASLFEAATIHWLGDLTRDDGCYGMQEGDPFHV